MKILITGVTGFIGKNVLSELVGKKNDITAIIRNSDSRLRLKEYADKINFVEIDLADTKKLANYLNKNSFDVTVHIGALLGRRKFSKSVFYKVNVDSTEQFLLNAQKNNSKFVFCSSVGVFGVIPDELPANNGTRKNPDNLYHETKILSEKLIEKYALNGVNTMIIRPSITYGEGDYGFPYMLVKYVRKRILPVSLQRFKIHLTNVSLLKMAFKKAVETDFQPGSAFVVADRNPVVFQELIDFIHQKFYDKPYPESRYIHPKFFQFGENMAKLIRNSMWESRFKLISKSWYYDVTESYEKLNLKKIETIPSFNSVIEWYKQKEG